MLIDSLIVFTGLLGGMIAWFPCGVGLAAHRYKLGGEVVRSTNRWLLLGLRSPATFSALGQLAFVLIVLLWMCIFLGALLAPVFIAQALEAPDASPSIGYAIYANIVVATISFLLGPPIWRKIAL